MDRCAVSWWIRKFVDMQLEVRNAVPALFLIVQTASEKLSRTHSYVTGFIHIFHDSFTCAMTHLHVLYLLLP